MAFSFSNDDIQKLVEWRSSVALVETNNVQLCPHCNGIGTIFREELTDYHRNDYTTTVNTCKFCLGDGRMVVTTRKLVYDSPSESMTIVPFVDFVGDKFAKKRTTYSIKIDLRNQKLEKKYPELEKMSYSHYDEMVNDYLALDLLKEK